ncbi:MAG: hypothetical protein AAFV46_00900 [Cyanobacteria bacterium J06635_11]
MAEKQRAKQIASSLTLNHTSAEASQGADPQGTTSINTAVDIAFIRRVENLTGDVKELAGELATVRANTKLAGEKLLTQIERLDGQFRERASATADLSQALKLIQRTVGELETDAESQHQDIRKLLSVTQQLSADLEVVAADKDVLKLETSRLKTQIDNVERSYLSVRAVALAVVTLFTGVGLLLLPYRRVAKLESVIRYQHEVLAQQQQTLQRLEGR